MSIISITRRNKPKLRGSSNASTRVLKEQWKITVDSLEDEPSTILDDPMIPKEGDPHPVDSLVTLKTLDIKNSGEYFTYFMDLVYDNNEDSSSPGGGGGSIEVLSVKIGTWEETVIEEQDYAGKPYRNSAGDKIKREVKRPQPEIIISAQTREPKFKQLLPLRGAVNSNPVNWISIEFDKTQLMLWDYDAETIGNRTWKENFIFRGRYAKDEQSPKGDPRDRSKGWQPQIIDAGFWELVEIDGEKVKQPIYETGTKGGKSSTKPVTQPWPLNGQGEAIDRDRIDDDRIFLDFTGFPETDFSVFVFDFKKILDDKFAKALGVD